LGDLFCTDSLFIVLPTVFCEAESYVPAKHLKLSCVILAVMSYAQQ